MAVKIRTWVWVVVAIIVTGILGLVVIAGVGFYFVSQNIDTRTVSPVGATQQFNAVKAEFPGQKPLIELDKRGQFVKANTDRAVKPQQKTPDHLYVLAFDPDDGRIVRFRVPFWLLRWKAGNATIDLNGNRMDLEDLRLTVEDLERFGPSVIVDHQSADGDRVLVWSK